MKLNKQHRREMTEKIVKEAMSKRFDAHNDEVRETATMVCEDRFKKHVEPYLAKLTVNELREGFSHRLQFQVLAQKLDGENQDGSPKFRRVKLLPLGYHRGNERSALFGSNDVPRFSPRDFTWTWEGVTTPYMCRNSMIKTLDDFDDFDDSLIWQDKVLALHNKAEALTLEADKLWALTSSALASCNTDDQVRKMLPSAIKFLPQKPVRTIVPVEQLDKANSEIKKALSGGVK